MPDVALTDAKERVRQAIDIVDLVGSYLSLRREGRSYKALCPWHNDRRPSMTVNPERQIFRCWVCNIGGDIFNFVMRMEGLEFPEALSLLAERAGIPLERSGGGGAAEDRKLLLQAAAWVEHEYHQCLLRDPAAEGARKYLAERGIHSDSIRRFHLGYAPDDWNWLQPRAKESNYSPQVLERIGVLSSSQRGGWYERFKGRVLFSIRDAQGRPVALGGRILPGNKDERAAKYVNSPETPLFSKSNLLYGLDAAREALAQSRTALVMEGYTDCIIAQQCGFHNALAVLGTALGPRHLQLLRRFVDRIVLVLDGDEAGRRRTDEILQLFIAEQADLRVLTLPNNLDPCDFLHEHGREEFERLLAGAVDALEHKFQTATQTAARESGTHAENRALEEILGTLAKAPRLPATGDSSAQIKEEQILNRLSHRFGVSEPTLRERLKSLRRKEERNGPAAAAPEQTPADPLTALEPLDREWIEALLRDPAGLANLPEPLLPSRLGHAQLRMVYSRSLELVAAGVLPDFSRLLLEFSQPEIQQLLVALDESATAKAEAGVRTDLAAVAAAFARKQEEFECRAQAAVLREKRIDAQQEVAILEQIVARSRLRHGISKSTEG